MLPTLEIFIVIQLTNYYSCLIVILALVDTMATAAAAAVPYGPDIKNGNTFL